MGQDLICFDRFAIDTRRRVLLANGKPVRLTSQPYQLLLYLIEHRDREVTPTDILQLLTGGQLRSGGYVTTQIGNVRDALGDTHRDPRFVRTIGKNYKFIGDIEPTPEPPETVAPHEAAFVAGGAGAGSAVGTAWVQRRAARHVAILPGVVLAALMVLSLAGFGVWHRLSNGPGPPPLSIVVRPFDYTGADASQAYLADEITDDLTSDLARLPASNVKSRDAAEAVRAEVPQHIRRILNVRYIVEGSVAPVEGHYHITAALVDTRTSVALWSQNFDSASSQLSEVRDRIVHQIESVLHLQLDQIEAARSLHDRPDDPGATDYYLRARSILDRDHSMKSFLEAAALLRRAVEMDTADANAPAELGWLLLRMVSTMSDPNSDADVREARAEIDHALAVAPYNPKALAARAREFQYDHDCAAALSEVDRVLKIDANNFDAWTVAASCALEERRFDDAASFYQRLLERDPVGPSSKARYLALGTIELIQGRFGGAMATLGRAKGDDGLTYDEMGPEEQARLMLIAAVDLSGDQARAKAEYKNYATHYPGRTTWRIATGYMPSDWAGIGGVKRLLAALHDAGMPEFDDGSAAIPDGAPCLDTNFALTPARLAGAKVLKAEDVWQLLKGSPPPLVIELGGGVEIIGNAYVSTAQSTPLSVDFALATAAAHAGAATARSIVVMGDGPTGCASYEAVKRLVSEHYSNVFWFRGGEEAWHFFLGRRAEAKAATLQ